MLGICLGKSFVFGISEGGMEVLWICDTRLYQ